MLETEAAIYGPFDRVQDPGCKQFTLAFEPLE